MKKAFSDLLLLDVNVLLAIAWPNHQFHVAATAALSRSNRWATCALTQLEFIRLSSNPAAVGAAKSPQEAATLMARLAADSLHVYLGSLPAPAAAGWREAFAEILGHQQVTDAYLVGLAAAHDAVLVTFDRRMESIARDRARVRVLGSDLAPGSTQTLAGRHRRRTAPER
jgi:toxin-antitoxin system PIN domain toxin